MHSMLVAGSVSISMTAPAEVACPPPRVWGGQALWQLPFLSALHALEGEHFTANMCLRDPAAGGAGERSVASEKPQTNEAASWAAGLSAGLPGALSTP